MAGKRSLKELNRKWLISYTVSQIVLYSIFSAVINPSFSGIESLIDKLKSPEGLFPLLAFPIIVIFEGLISSDIKAILVYWRLKHPYPGSRAFTVIGQRDHRVKMDHIRAKFPNGLPEDPKPQNDSWYEIYSDFQNETIVYDTHRSFLLCRDLAIITLIFIPFFIISHLIWPIPIKMAIYHIMTLAGIYALICISAQNYGRRMVANVLALASIQHQRTIKSENTRMHHI